MFTPLLATGIGIASTIITIGDPTSSCSGPATGGSGLSGAQSVMQGINCPMAGIQSQFAEGMAIGVAVLVSPNACPANNSTLGGFIIGFSQSMFSLVQMLMNVICGLVLIVIYFFDYLAFPLLLLDVILRATVIAVISPVALAASLFGPTRHLAKKAAWGLVQAGLTLVFAAVVGAIGKSSIAAIFSGLATNGTPITDWNSLSAALSDPCGSGLSFGLTSPAFYKVAGLGVMLIYMMRKASGMAADFTGAAAGDWTGGRAGVATVIGNGTYMIGGTIDAARGRIAGGGGGVRKDIAAAVSGRSAPDEEND